MEVINLPVKQLVEAAWNANQADEVTMERLRISIGRYGMVQNLVVRPLGSKFEVLSGNQRLRLVRDIGVKKVPCVVVNVNDAHARLLAQALNHIHGEDDLGQKAELIRKVLETLPEEEVLSILPETLDGLRGLASIGQETIATYLLNWERVRAVRLRHLQFKFTIEQLEVVEAAVSRALPMARKIQGMSPNQRSTALYLICQEFLDGGKHEE